MSTRAQIMDGLLSQLQTINIGQTCTSRQGETYLYQTNLGESTHLFRKAPMAADEVELLNIVDPTLERNQDTENRRSGGTLNTVENVLPVALVYFLKGDSEEGRAAALLAEEDLIKCLDAWETTIYAADCFFVVEKTELILQQHEMGFAALNVSITVEYTTEYGSC